jgi:hypothetical protein
MSGRRLLVAVACAAIVAISVGRGRLAPAAADVEVEEQDAIKAAQQFIRTLGVKPAKSAPSATREIIYWNVDVGGSYRVYVDTYTGKPVSFRYTARLLDIEHGLGRTGKQRFADRAEAETYVRQLAKTLGLPSGWTLDRLDLGPKEVRASFSERPHGHPFLSPMSGASSMFLSFDAQDGALKRWDFIDLATDPANVRINQNQAIAAAQQEYNQYLQTHHRAPFHGGAMNAANVRLGYATTPESRISGKRRPSRLYWNVPFGTQPVWVDAETGKVYLEEIQLK